MPKAPISEESRDKPEGLLLGKKKKKIIRVFGVGLPTPDKAKKLKNKMAQNSKAKK